MENKLKYPKNHLMLNQIHFEEEHKRHVLKTIANLPDNNEINVKNKGRKRMKTFFYSSAAAVAFLALFIGSSYVSPFMAEVAAKIPYFNLFIKQEEYKHDIYEVISDVANEKQYALNTLDVSLPKKEITLSIIGSKEEVNSLKGEVAKNMNAALEAHHFGTFDINVKREKMNVQKIQEDSPEVKKYMKDSQELERSIIEQLEKNHYIMAFPPQVRINEIEKYIFVAVPKNEKRMQELEELLRAASKDYGEFKLDVRRIDMNAREQEQRWEKNNIIGILAGGLTENEDFKVTGFSYSFHPLPLQINIKTSVKSSDPDAKEHAAKIEKEIQDFIQTDELTKEVRNDPYKLTIYSKDKKKLN